MIVEVAKLLGRTPGSLAMKLTNFASLDPAHRERGVRGLAGHSRLDGEIWNEFQNHWEEMALLSEEKLHGLEPHDAGSDDVVTEVESTRMARTKQAFFRKVVFAAYDSTCSITKNPIPELLVASHILPWSEFPKERLNPRNGICLAAHFDRAFDRGLISFDRDLRLVLGRRLQEHLPNEALEAEFVRRAGQPLLCPDRFAPDPGFLAQHRRRFGFG
jgi:putative restriction endonuclease